MRNMREIYPKYMHGREYCATMTYVSILYDKSIHLLANAPTCLHVSVSVGQNPGLAIVSYKSEACGNTSFAAPREMSRPLIKVPHNICIRSFPFFNITQSYAMEKSEKTKSRKEEGKLRVSSPRTKVQGVKVRGSLLFSVLNSQRHPSPRVSRGRAVSPRNHSGRAK